MPPLPPSQRDARKPPAPLPARPEPSRLTALTPSLAAAPTVAPPPRWEHLIAEVGRDGERLPSLEGQGWEAIAVIESRVDSLRLLLKRPKQEPTKTL